RECCREQEREREQIVFGFWCLQMIIFCSLGVHSRSSEALTLSPSMSVGEGKHTRLCMQPKKVLKLPVFAPTFTKWSVCVCVCPLMYSMYSVERAGESGDHNPIHLPTATD